MSLASAVPTAVISGGGAGHEPMDRGFVGQGMLAACITGPHFTSPSAPDIADLMSRILDEKQSHEVLAIVKNYTGDVLNFELAAELLEAADHSCTLVYVHDDVATRDVHQGGRGIAGTVLYEKVLGAGAYRGMNSQQLCAIADQIEDSIVSYGICFHPPTTVRGTPFFDLPSGYAEMGVGVHGERGTRRIAFERREDVINEAVDVVFSHLKPGKDPLIVLVNNLGTAREKDMNTAVARVENCAQQKGEVIARLKVGCFATSVDMDGLSLTLMRANPDILSLYDTPTLAPAWSEQ